MRVNFLNFIYLILFGMFNFLVKLINNKNYLREFNLWLKSNYLPDEYRTNYYIKTPLYTSILFFDEIRYKQNYSLGQ